MSDPYVIGRAKELAPAFLEGLYPEELTEALSAGTLRKVPARSVIESEGHSADEFCLLLEGRARHFATTSEGEKIGLKLLLPGEVTRGMALVKKPTDYLVSTETLADGAILVWSREAILALAKQYPVLLENMILIGADYLIAYRDRHNAATFDKASSRVAWELDRLAMEMGQRVNGGTELIVSNEELARLASVTPLTVSRLLGKWQRKGLLVKDRGRIRLSSPEQLVRMAG